jgi:hypothetical protein
MAMILLGIGMALLILFPPTILASVIVIVTDPAEHRERREHQHTTYLDEKCAAYERELCCT